MKAYTIATDQYALDHNNGIEIMASSVTEALDKYQAMFGRSNSNPEGTEQAIVRLPDGIVSPCLLVSKPKYESREGELI